MPENIPEGCTPADARMLRRANHRLISELEELQARFKKLHAEALALQESLLAWSGRTVMPASHERSMFEHWAEREGLECGGALDIAWSAWQARAALTVSLVDHWKTHLQKER